MPQWPDEICSAMVTYRPIGDANTSPPDTRPGLQMAWYCSLPTGHSGEHEYDNLRWTNDDDLHVVGVALEHSIEDPFTGEVNVRLRF